LKTKGELSSWALHGPPKFPGAGTVIDREIRIRDCTTERLRRRENLKRDRMRVLTARQNVSGQRVVRIKREGTSDLLYKTEANGQGGSSRVTCLTLSVQDIKDKNKPRRRPKYGAPPVN